MHLFLRAAHALGLIPGRMEGDGSKEYDGLIMMMQLSLCWDIKRKPGKEVYDRQWGTMPSPHHRLGYYVNDLGDQSSDSSTSDTTDSSIDLSDY